MDERIFFESETLIDSLVDGLKTIDVEIAPEELLNILQEKQADALNDSLVELFRDPMLGEHVETVDNVEPPGIPRGFGSLLRKSVKEGRIARMTFFRVKPSWETSAISLIGIGLGLAFLSPTAIVPGVGLIRNVWKNLITLRRPEDSRAIDTYEALLKAQVLHKEGTRINVYYPTVRDIHEASGVLEERAIVLGLAQLKDLKLVEVKKWGGQSWDYEHPENRWYQVF